MQLKTIKVSGFKSFADPTTIPLKSHLTAIVGPNGCGKSNVVDAVRCVLSGAAKQLRGGTMPDVIFNGSANRKPVGQASVELIFDNGDGGLGGEYAQYQEISVRREINRDGTSDYSLNGVRCRRKDILDIFLGTGLGAQSYAIIEQGMISRLIEAKPEELRIHLEEVAGISKYKERRRETENRIEHTKENLDRLNDHRLELDKQLSHLKRQANAAERYKEYKQEERVQKAQLQAIHWRELQQQLEQQSSDILETENRHEATIAELRQLDAEIEKYRQQKLTSTDEFNVVQNRFYTLGAEIARLEQNVKNARDRRSQLQSDLAKLESSYQETSRTHEDDQLQIGDLQEEIAQLEPEVVSAKKAVEEANAELVNAEKTMHDWQAQWDEFNQRAAKNNKEIEIEQTRIQHLQQSLQQIQQRNIRIEEELQQIDVTQLSQSIHELTQENNQFQTQTQQLQQNLENFQQQIKIQKANEEQTSHELNQARHSLQSLTGRLASLEALQQAALGKTDQHVNHWLQQQQLQQQPRLAENLEVESGWETAIETVLGPYLEAVCVNDFTNLNESLNQLDKGQLTLISSSQSRNAKNNSKPKLIDKIKNAWSLPDLLTDILIAEDFNAALSLQNQLAEYESVVTREGIWLGRNWVRINRQLDAKAGILQRERELHELQKTIAQQQEQLSNKEIFLQQLKANLAELEIQRQQTQQAYLAQAAKLSEVNAQLLAKQNNLQQFQQREQRLRNELNDNQQQAINFEKQSENSHSALQQAQILQTNYIEEKATLLQQREDYRADLESCRSKTREQKEQADELAVRLESSRTQLHYLGQAIQRAAKQLTELAQQRDDLTNQQQALEEPLQIAQQQLEVALQNRLTVERELETARQQLNQIEHDLTAQEKKRNLINSTIQTLRNELEQGRMQLQALQIRQSHHLEKIQELQSQLEELLTQLQPEANITEWQERITQIENRIQRLGPINLAAIDEYEKLSERKTYLDAQNNDLLEAMATLENAIRKIDRETRDRLQETYDKVNQEFGQLFQRIFNGGNACLEMTDNDLLNTGIIVKAQPPGKRNSTIHLLSGGEKALTAIALVFALFHLNPAPFCILDEVDAPLDDLNVGRFCALVKEMAQKVQFIFISHNKLSIEIAEQLIGVTMNEPGVSRLVSVDIEQAIAMATA